MKKFTLIDIVTFVGIVSSILLVLMFASGCSMKFYKTPADVRNCCERVSAHAAEMEKFNRYCKVALFLANSENIKAVGPKVREGARDAVNVCKFVFAVETDEELVSAGDAQRAVLELMYRVRSHIIKQRTTDPFWIRQQCDPAEIHCEEF